MKRVVFLAVPLLMFVGFLGGVLVHLSSAQWVRLAPSVFPAGVAVAAALIAAGAAISVATEQSSSTRSHWFMEQRRDACVELLHSTKAAYEAFVAYGSEGGCRPDSPNLGQLHQDAEHQFGLATHAASVLRILGPDELMNAGNKVVARLRLDRRLYSPERHVDLASSKSVVLGIAKDIGDPPMLDALEAAFAQSPVSVAAYEEAHQLYRLDKAWEDFTAQAREVIGAPSGRSGSRKA